MVVVKPMAYRLPELTAKPGGVPEALLLARATQELAKLQGSMTQALDVALEDAGAAAVPVQPDRLRAAAVRIVEAAAHAGRKQVGEAAYSLCDLLEAGAEDDAGMDAVRVHLEAMRALRSVELDGSETGSVVLRELRNLVVKHRRRTSGQGVGRGAP